MLRFLMFIPLTFFLISCQSRSKETFTKYYEDGRAKPSVAIVPVVDSTNFNYPWSLSEEFTDLLITKISHKHSLFLPEDGIIKYDFSYSQDLFGTDLEWMKQAFNPHEFVVLVEFLQHKKSPVSKKNTPTAELSSNLNLTVRLRIIDLRKNQPEIVLQEKISDSYFISKNVLPTNYEIVTWGSDEYKTSSLALAHGQIAKEVVERINDYISLAKSR